MINWKVRFKNKAFWIAIIPAVLVLIKCICSMFGMDVDFTEIQNQLINLVGAIFVVLAILGIVTDPTTNGLGDSANALMYESPKIDEEEEEADRANEVDRDEEEV